MHILWGLCLFITQKTDKTEWPKTELYEKIVNKSQLIQSIDTDIIIVALKPGFHYSMIIPAFE